MLLPNEWYDIVRDKRRAENVARELCDILRRYPDIFKRVSRRSKRWLEKQDLLALQRLDAKDAVALQIKKKQLALSKLTQEEQILLGLLELEEE